MKSIVAFIGTNGSGKTTMLIEIFELIEGKKIEDCIYQDQTIGKKAKALGKYKKGKTTGSDSFKLSEARKRMLLDDTNLSFLYDGVLGIGTPQFEVYELLRKRGVNVIICYLKVSVEEAERRVKKRNGGKDIGDGLVKKKYSYDRMIENLKLKFPLFNYITIDTENEESVEKSKNMIISLLK